MAKHAGLSIFQSDPKGRRMALLPAVDHMGPLGPFSFCPENFKCSMTEVLLSENHLLPEKDKTGPNRPNMVPYDQQKVNWPFNNAIFAALLQNL